MRALLALILVATLAGTAAAAPDVPTPPHPRLLLDDALRTAWKASARQAGSHVARAVARCDDIGKRPKEFARDLYMGLDWAGHLQNCLVAYAATGKDAHADTAHRYFVAMLDDLDNVGDGKGGNNAARRDSGFAIRAMGPYTALAYDWLHDRLTEAERARARERFAAWTSWYLTDGYRARSPSTNYHAGYLIAVTFIAIAQNGEAGKAGNDLWRLVRDELWGKDMAKAFATGGVLDGGDWGEGWQYAPLSVAEYAIAARAMTQQGVRSDGVRRWLDDVVRRHVHALSPGAGVFVGGDTQDANPNLAPNFLTLAAVVLGDASPDSKAWAAHELDRLELGNDQWALYGALVDAAGAAGVKPAPVPRDSWPTAYLARGVGTLYTRSHWGKDAVWSVVQCNRTIDVDHVHPNAGNFVVSRGPDDLIVDPTPYGSLSSLTSNAPTVVSAQLPDDYKPSQAFWSEKTGFGWARQTASGIVVARCDYADQYKFQHRPSDVPFARRDLVVVPWPGGKDATVVVVDRADSGDKQRPLHLRFRALAKLERAGDVVRGSRGASSLTIQRLWSSGGSPELRSVKQSSCFDPGHTRGGCDAARFAVDEYRLVVPGATMDAAHVIDVGPVRATPSAAVADKQGAVTVVTAERPGGKLAVVVGGSGALTYRGPAGARHVVLEAPADASVSASPAGKGSCTITFGSGSKLTGKPAVFTVDDACALVDDPTQRQPLAGPTGGADEVDAGAEGVAAASPDAAAAAAASGEDGSIETPRGTLPRSARSGCCGAQATPGSPIAMTVVVLGWLLGARRRRRR